MTDAPDLDVELLARLAHEQYLQHTPALGGPASERSLIPWNELSETLRDSNRAQAGHIPVKLAAIGCRLAPGGPEQPFTFDDDEIETLARLEHDRWWLDRVVDGWTLGPDPDDARRVSPWLVPWTELPHEIRARDRAAVLTIPMLLAAAELRIVRIADAAEPPGDLVELLATAVPDFAERRPRFEALGRRIVAVVREVCATVAPTAIVTTRAKAVDGFAEKIVRKYPKYRDPIAEITDLCGVRVIVRTRSEVDAVSERIPARFAVDVANSMSHTQRLHPTEFGYRSVHFVVTLRAEDVEDDARDLLGLKAEVQLRTIAEHAWADFDHELSYKGAFALPDRWTRELAIIAAHAETIDEAFADIEHGVRVYASSYGAHLGVDDLAVELARVRALVATLPEDLRLVVRLARLLCASGAASEAERILDDYCRRHQSQFEGVLSQTTAELLRELGELRCRRGASTSDGDAVREGRAMLERSAHALAYANERADAFARLGDMSSGESDQRRWYDEAFATDPGDPRALTRYIESRHGLPVPETVAMLRPAIDQAQARCRAQLEVGHNTPRALVTLGELTLLLGNTYGALNFYSQAVCAGHHADVVQEALLAVDRLRRQPSCPEDFGSVRWLLLLALVGRFREPTHAAELMALATRRDGSVSRIAAPAVIVAGATDREASHYESLLLQAFKDFSGTVLSGGTAEGISGAVGALGATDHDLGARRTVGYLPARMPDDGTATRDLRFSELRMSAGDGFGPAEPLQLWTDIVASSIDPGDIKMLAIGGGDLTAFEIALALALGAQVGVVSGSGGASDASLADVEWTVLTPRRRIALPDDPATVRAFVGSGTSELDDDRRERIARMVHEKYREHVEERERAAMLSARAFDGLPDALRSSNLRQADHIAAKLREIGCRVVPAPARTTVAFDAGEVETLAEMEHGRWCAEKLADGYKLGERRDEDARTHPDLVPWRVLSESSQAVCRATVRAIPDQLAGVGLAVERIVG